MLTLLHGNNPPSRRQFIQLGGLSALGLGLPSLLASQQAQAASARKEVNCILVWMLGGPSHIDMYDLKPDAPAEIRGELNPIPTRTPGVELGELMPNMAACSDKFSIIRSMTSPDPTHGRADHFLMSGNRLTSDLSPPGFGAMLAWQQERQKARQTPPFVQVGTISSPRYGNPGHGGYLGRNYNPFLVDDPNSSSFKVEAFSSPDNVDVGRLSNRQALLAAVDGFQARHETPLPLVRTHDKFTEQAFSMITSEKAKNAFDIQQEQDVVRDAYGRNRVGQGMLLARRLCECKEQLNIPKSAMIEKGFTEQEVDDGLEIFGPKGCDKCKDGGYKGRIGIYEVMKITEEIQRIIMEDGNSLQIAAVSRKQGFNTIFQSAMLKVKNGMTSLDEIDRVTSGH